MRRCARVPMWSNARDDAHVLPDGDYDGCIVDAQSHRDRATLSIAITAGDQRGVVVDVAATKLGDDQAIALLGLPCALTVTDGEPSVQF